MELLFVIYWDVMFDLSFPGDIPSISLVQDGQWLIVVLPERWICCNSIAVLWLFLAFDITQKLSICRVSRVKQLQDTNHLKKCKWGNFFLFIVRLTEKHWIPLLALILHWQFLLCFKYNRSSNYDRISDVSQYELLKWTPGLESGSIFLVNFVNSKHMLHQHKVYQSEKDLEYYYCDSIVNLSGSEVI